MVLNEIARSVATTGKGRSYTMLPDTRWRLMPRLNRRDFMTTTAAAGLAAAARPLGADSGPTVRTQAPFKPIVISAANGHRFKNGGTKTCVEIAFEKITRGDDVL